MRIPFRTAAFFIISITFLIPICFVAQAQEDLTDSTNRFQHRKTIALNDKENIFIYHEKLNDLKLPADLSLSLDLAKQYIIYLADSFKHINSSKKLIIDYYRTDEFSTVSYEEQMTQLNNLALKDGEFYNLKINMDEVTVRLHENKQVKHAQVIIQLSINQLDNLVLLNENPVLLSQINDKLTQYHDQLNTKWKHPDKGHNKYSILNYNVNKDSLHTIDIPSGLVGFAKGFILHGAIGVGLTAQGASIGMTTSMGYRFYDGTPESPFVAFNTTFLILPEQSFSKFSTLSSMNAEIGLCKKSKNSSFINSKFSIGYGVAYLSDNFGNRIDNKYMHNFMFCYSPTSYINITFQGAYEKLFKIDEHHKAIGSLVIAYNL